MCAGQISYGQAIEKYLARNENNKECRTFNFESNRLITNVIFKYLD
jgi:hypothetical protein